MFLDDDQNISKDALDVLEAKAIDYVRTHGSYETDNSATPKPYVDPYKEEAVERLHDRILFRMAALGYDLDRVDQGPAGAPAASTRRRTAVRGAGRYDKATGALHRARWLESEPLETCAENAAVAAARRETSAIRAVSQSSTKISSSRRPAPRRCSCSAAARTAGPNGQATTEKRSTKSIEARKTR